MTLREKLTPATISANISYLASLSEHELADNNTHELRRLLKGCGVTQVECLNERYSKGILVKVGEELRRADANKDECLKAIADITKDRKLIASATGFDSQVIIRLEELPQKSWLLRAIVDQETPTREVAEELNRRILADYPEQHQFGTRTVIRSKYTGMLKARLKARGLFQGNVFDRFEGFRKHLIDIGQPESNAKNAQITARREERRAFNRETTTYVNFNYTPLLRWAAHTLENLPASPRGKWHEVALALALVTGRRCTSEILCSQTQAQQENDSEIRWSGLAKERENTNKPDSMVAPTLVNACLVMEAIDWLAKHDKREKDRDRCHARFSSDLTKCWRNIAKQLELPVFEHMPDKEQQELHKVHGARKLYTNIVLLREGLTEGKAHPDDINDRARVILGHEKEETSAFYRLPMMLIEA